MAYIGAFICMFGAIISYYCDKRLYSPLVLFASFWSIILFLSGLELYNIYPVSFYALVIVVVGTICFTIGGGFAKKKSYCNICILNKRVYKWAVIVCVCALYLNISFIFAFVSSGFDIHYIYTIMANISGGEENELSGLYDPKLEILQQFIGYPLLYTIVPISIVEYISTKEKQYLIVAVFLSLVRFLFDFRRTYIVIIFVFILFVYIIRNRKRMYPSKLKKEYKLSFKKKILLCCVVLMIAAVFSILSSARKGDEGAEDYSLFSNFYYYYVGSMPYLSARISSLHDFDFTYGLTSFRGLFSPLFSVLNVFGADKPQLITLANENVNSLHNTVLYISKNHPFNSYATCFFEFYLDGGMLGVIIISFLFGYYAEFLFQNMMANKTNRYIVKYAFFVSLFLYLSVLHFNGVVVCYIWPFILERYFYKKQV